MRNSLRVHADRSLRDPPAGFVVPLHIVHDLVRVDVAVVVWHRDRFGVEIQRSGAERTDHEVVPLKCLMYGWGQVKLASDWREIVDVKAVRVVTAVPTNDLEWVVGIDVRVNRVQGLDPDFELALLVVREWVIFVLEGDSQVSLAVRGVFKEL